MSRQNAKALKSKKEEGNKAFKEGDYEAAYELYSAALTIDPNNIKTNAKLFCNRGTVGSKVSTRGRRRCMHIYESFACHTYLFFVQTQTLAHFLSCLYIYMVTSGDINKGIVLSY